MIKTKITPHEWQVVEERFKHFKVPPKLIAAIREAMRALNRGEFVYNGTTLDEELGPNNLEEASLLHDYMWAMGWGGHSSNLIYMKSLKIYKVSKVTRVYRMLGITIGWYSFHLWKCFFKRNLRTVPQRFKNVLTQLE